MLLQDMLMLGDPRLYQKCDPIEKTELDQVKIWAAGLDSIILQFQAKYGAGRAVAAPQMGIMKRLVCMHIDQPVVMINPYLTDQSENMIELWDDCMCFPNLLVRVRRHQNCILHYKNLNWQDEKRHLEDDLSELLQHEIDHLDGILATQRAIDGLSFKWRK